MEQVKKKEERRKRKSDEKRDIRREVGEGGREEHRWATTQKDRGRKKEVVALINLKLCTSR